MTLDEYNDEFFLSMKQGIQTCQRHRKHLAILKRDLKAPVNKAKARAHKIHKIKHRQNNPYKRI